MAISNPTLFRSNVVSKLTEKMDAKSASNMEKGIFNWTIKEATSRKIVKKWCNRHFGTIYTDRFRSIWCNLNSDIIEKINSGEVSSQTVAFMTHQELQPKRWDGAIQRKILLDKSKYELNIEAASDSFKCRKCHLNKTTHYQMQTRSADEPMTTFVTCLNCDAKWKC
jgi:DNA-directed RNA polymerase subunit M/transcription elongation factor TFIIS